MEMMIGIFKLKICFYTAEGDRKDDPSGALKKFQQCVALEEKEAPDEVDKRFPSLKYITILQFQMKQISDMTATYQKLLGYASSVTPNELNGAIRAILTSVEESNDKTTLAKMYEITLDFFSSSGKDRFWFEYAMRLCKTYFESNDLKRCTEV